MHFDYYKIACDLFLLLAAVWLFGLLSAKPNARIQSPGSRLLEMGLNILAFSLVFTNYFQSGWRARNFVPNSDLAGVPGSCWSCWASLSQSGLAWSWAGTGAPRLP